MKKTVKKITAIAVAASLFFSVNGAQAASGETKRMDKAEIHKTLEEIRAKVHKKSSEINLGECAKPSVKAEAVPVEKHEVKTLPPLPEKKEQAADVQQAVPAPAPAPAPAAAPADKPANPLAIAGYTQILHSVSDVPADSHSFNIARTRFVFKRKLDDDLNFFSQFNVAGNNAEGAQMTVTDLFLQYNLDKSQNLMLGQFVMPSNYEAIMSPRDLYMINYGQHIINADHENRGNDLRDLGVTYNYRKPGETWGLSVAAANGEGINTQNDSNDSKTIAAKLDFDASKDLKLGLYASEGKRFKAASTAAQVAFYGADGAATPAKSFDRKRAGFDFRFKKEKMTLQGVFEALETGLAGRARNLKGKGMFVQAGYFVMPKLEMTYKHDVFLPNNDNTATKRTVNAGGFNWFIKKGAKLQMVYQKQKETPEVKNDRLDTQVTVEF